MTTVMKDRETSAGAAAPAQKRRVLDTLPTGTRTTGDEAAARSRLVRRLRIALPIVALVLVAAFLFNTRSNVVEDAFLDDFKDFSPGAVEKSMASPRFTGIDNKGRPFEIEADAAKQRQDSQDLVELDRPRAVQGTKGSDETTKVTAAKGVYHQEDNLLELESDVTLEHDVGADNYVFRAPSATVSITDEVVTSDAGVGGEGPEGRRIEADRLKAYNAEGRVVLEGNVHMRIYPKSKTADDGAAPADESGPPALKDPETGTSQ